jgi:hypothetical protein
MKVMTWHWTLSFSFSASQTSAIAERHYSIFFLTEVSKETLAYFFHFFYNTDLFKFAPTGVDPRSAGATQVL